MRVFPLFFSTAILLAALTPSAAGAELKTLLQTLRSVGPKGAGNGHAASAWEELVRANARDLPAILAGLDDAGPLAANWIRTAADAIAERELRRGGTLPAAELERFALDTSHAPRARRLAYEWLCRVDDSAPQRLIPGMLDDPSLEFRRDAVVRLIRQADQLAKSKQNDQAAPVYQQALTAARDLDQINFLTGRLRSFGRTIDLPRHFGFLVRWKLIGPFDNTDEKGYDAVYPPEREIDVNGSYEGKQGKVSWIDHVTKHDYGQVDLNPLLGEKKEVLGYATAEFVCEQPQEVEFRSASFNALKLWLNGKLIDRRNVYHGGSQMDQYVCRARLQGGRNVILLKVCQNAQTQDWARPWAFQLRVCRGDGTAVLSADRDR